VARFTVQNLSTLSLLASFTAASSSLSDEFLNNGHTILYVKNSVAVANVISVTSRFSPVPKGLAVANITIDVTANGEKLCGFFDDRAYNDSSGCVTISYTTHTGLTVAVISVT
jgi:hypothetical protein